VRTFIGIVVSFFLFFILIFMIKFVYVVPNNRYSILDQTGEVRLEDYPELKEVSFMYSTDLLIEFYERIDNLKLEKINLRFNNDIIGVIEINTEVYDSLEDGRFYIDIYIKDLKTNKTFIIKRDNISIYYESGGPKIFIPSV